MGAQIRSTVHFVLLIVFIFSQVMAQPASAAGTSHLDGETVLQGECVPPPLRSEPNCTG
jgi:hypothetical protein